MIDVVWWTLDPASINRGYWDQGTIEDLFAGQLWPLPAGVEFRHRNHPHEVTDGDGAIVVLPGRFHADRVAEVTDGLSSLAWVLLIVTSDEERLFPLDQLRWVDRLWVQTPKTGDPGFHFGHGYPPGLRALSRTLDLDDRDRTWFFSGQMTHPRRREAGRVLQRLSDTAGDRRFYATPGFTQGMDQVEFWREVARATVAPAPSGPATPDSFRAWEALELAAVPLVDGATPQGPDDYWARMTAPAHPLPVIADWRDAPAIIDRVVGDWPRRNTDALAWWMGTKRAMAAQLTDDLDAVGAIAPPGQQIDDLITVVMPTSQIPSHPSTAVIDETLATVRAHLPRAEVLITADGGTGAGYDEYLWRLVLACHQRHDRVLPIIHRRHLHQAEMMRQVLPLVRTPLVLYVEHDAPLTPDREIPWEAAAAAIGSGEINALRFHFETGVHPEHVHLMPDLEPRHAAVGALPYLRCAQWSQRPHLAATDYYRRILADHFEVGRPAFIEDVMHSVLDCAWRDHGLAGWDHHRLAMFAPPGDIKRSYHLDGRRYHP